MEGGDGVANEAFARVKIDQLLKDAGWKLTDGISVRFEYPLDDGGKADYALFDRQGRALAVLEAKSTSVNLSAGEAQGRRYADQLGVAFIFLSNGEEVWVRDKGQDAHFRKVDTVFSQDDLMRRKRLSCECCSPPFSTVRRTIPGDRYSMALRSSAGLSTCYRRQPALWRTTSSSPFTKPRACGRRRQLRRPPQQVRRGYSPSPRA